MNSECKSKRVATDCVDWSCLIRARCCEAWRRDIHHDEPSHRRSIALPRPRLQRDVLEADPGDHPAAIEPDELARRCAQRHPARDVFERDVSRFCRRERLRLWAGSVDSTIVRPAALAVDIVAAVVALYPYHRAVVRRAHAVALPFDANVPRRDVSHEPASVLSPPVAQDWAAEVEHQAVLDQHVGGWQMRLDSKAVPARLEGDAVVAV